MKKQYNLNLKSEATFHYKKSKSDTLLHRGFALISTIIIMALLSVILLVSLSLSSIETRSSDTTKGIEIAKSNARVALMLAISELQKTTGPDTRITAPADIFSTSENHVRQLTGAWHSWKGRNQDTTSGRPIAPDYDSKKVTFDENNPDSGHFIKWLISDLSQDLTDPNSPPSVEESETTVPMLATGSVAEDSGLEVHITPTKITNNNLEGSYAWWIQSENTKARLRTPIEASSTIDAINQLVLSPGPSGKDFGIEDTSDIEKAITHNSLAFLRESTDEAADPVKLFHDLSVYSSGLMTNVANGGWKRDLSLFSENFDTIETGFSSFTLSPGNTFEAGKSNTEASSSHPLIYPWINSWSQNSAYPDCVSWNALSNFTTNYKKLSSSGEELPQIKAYTQRTHAKWVDEIRRMPIIARVHLVISLSSREDPADSSKHFPGILLNPVITLWNPYNITLDTSDYPTLPVSLHDASCPITFDFEVNSSEYANPVTTDLSKIVANATNNASNLSANIPLAANPLWLPGEVRVYSPTGNVEVNKNVRNSITFAAGFRPESGLQYVLPGAVSVPSSTTMSVSEARLDATFDGPNVNGVGMYYTYRLGAGSNSADKNVSCLLDLIDAQKMLGQNIELTATSSSSLSSLDNTPQPILSSIVGLRYGRDTNSNRDNIIVNGLHNMNPVVGFMINGSATTDATELKGRFDVFPYNIQLYPINSLADPGVPSGVEDELEGYIGSGFGSSDGLSNLVLLELPTRPLHSIGDLQHFNINACDDSGPFTLNALGNSRTSPFIASDNIRVAPLDAAGQEVGHDHSYAMNHIFQDDWFISTVSPDLEDWSQTESRSIEKVYEELLSANQDLPNHYYKPVTTFSETEAAEKASEFLSDEDSWMKIAAEFEVEGMFNINSTSELAWAMLLKRNFENNNPGVLSLEGSTPGNPDASTTLEDAEGSPFPRTQLISDSQAGSGGFSLLGQHQRFTDDQITALAKEIVVEIKKRGPFLSLSEFYNRQLSTDTELARSGAIEAALNSLSNTTGDDNPYTEIQEVFTDSASKNNLADEALTYPFAETAEGNPAYGFPGWTRQADILRPISGILSARDDTFTIRAYGASKDRNGNTTSEVWCEAIVQRTPNFVNGGDKYELPTDETHPLGRKYEIKQFRWLSQNEL